MEICRHSTINFAQEFLILYNPGQLFFLCDEPSNLIRAYAVLAVILFYPSDTCANVVSKPFDKQVVTVSPMILGMQGRTEIETIIKSALCGSNKVVQE